MINFVDPRKVVARNVQNEGVSKVKTESFGHGGLKHSFSQVEGDLDLQKILKLVPLPKKRATKKKATIVIMKEEDEEGEKVEKVGKNWADGEVLHLIAL